MGPQALQALPRGPRRCPDHLLLPAETPSVPRFLAFEETDCELLVGRGVVPDDLNDDAVGRALDKFTAGRSAKIFAAICARAAVTETVDQSCLHWDSTSGSFAGDYDRPSNRSCSPC